MYEENRRFSWTNLFIKVIIIIIFILFTVWLLSLSSKGLSNKVNVLTESVFSDNIDRMKEVGKSYFTTERLPKKVGEVKTLTLQKMYDKKLILELKDKNGKKCSAENSYVSIEKLDTEYQMKVYLECGKEADYVITIMGCYNYCNTAICEKQVEENKAIEYEYSKTTGGSWGPWGAWTNWSTGVVTKTNNRDVESKIQNETYTYDKPVTETKNLGEATCDDIEGYKLVSNKNGVCSYSKTTTYTKKPTCPTVDGYILASQEGFNCGYKRDGAETVNPVCPTVDGYKNTGRSGFTCNYSKSTTDTKTPTCPEVDGYKNTGRDGFTCNYSKTNTLTANPSCPTVDGYENTGRDGFTCSYSQTVTSTTDYDLVYYKSGSGSYVPGDNNTYHYVQTSADYQYNCNSSCSFQWYYTYKVYKKEYKTETITTTATAKCPSGYVQSGSSCVKNTTSTTTKDAVCASGYTPSGNNCVKTTSSKTTKTASCPSGYTQSENSCVSYITATKTASCASGYTKSGNNCVKTTTDTKTKDAVCAAGTMKDGKCTKTTTTYVKETGTKSVTYYRYRIRTYNGGTADYKWSTSNNDKSLLDAGYKLTGKTRELGGSK